VLATGVTAPIHAGIPTIGAANIIQTTVTAFESVAQNALAFYQNRLGSLRARAKKD